MPTNNQRAIIDELAELTPGERARDHRHAAVELLRAPVPPTQVALVHATLALEARLEHIADELGSIAVATVRQ